jgi:hypothetical protein
MHGDSRNPLALAGFGQTLIENSRSEDDALA